MDEETKPPFATPAPAEPEKFDPANGHAESHLFSLSLRGLLALALVGGLLYLVIALHTDKIIDAFLIIVSGAIQFYFGQNTRK